MNYKLARIIYGRISNLKSFLETLVLTLHGESCLIVVCKDALRIYLL
jgi:hypothetical protein